ncbi:MAG: DUF2806 domain-containing protein [Gammaproteobacteria bacterium]|nr:DUF2806 domain-containing protein [Gammaproteobacteria bacterium]MBU1505786.1 DUF2806 domain-containing protein [Gammaproteobacteria bacterium]MBU2119474.1 DUF2806 domain-containing protein [Gammaproteobacteria bacterium]MBU2172620.1 DUF2806 domain-containing protein [Gammaproteobacteria bacterium]MBU2202078.1 DUF2806 domain-containing protein [Gammaproteobacteria bacterium]
MPAHEPVRSTEQKDSDLLTTAASLVTTGLAPIPLPIKKRAIEAISMLIGAGVDRWTAKLEESPAITRAHTAAQVRVIDAIGAKVADQLEISPDLAADALQQHASKIVRNHRNVKKVVDQACRELIEPWLLPDASEDQKELSDDWLNAFQTEAEKMSSAYMQAVFGKILASEIRKPGSVSLRTISLVAHLDREVAEFFAIYCSMAGGYLEGNEIRIVMLMSAGRNPSRNGLGEFGLSFRALMVLVEYGLLLSELSTTQVIELKGTNNVIDFIYCGSRWKAMDSAPTHAARNINLTGVMASRAGSELFTAVAPVRNPQYEALMVESWRTLGFKVAMSRN